MAHEPLLTIERLADAAPWLAALWIASILLLAFLEASFGDMRGSAALRRWRLPIILATLAIYTLPFAFGMLIGFPLFEQGSFLLATIALLGSPFASLILAVTIKKAVLALLGGRTRHIGPPPA